MEKKLTILQGESGIWSARWGDRWNWVEVGAGHCPRNADERVVIPRQLARIARGEKWTPASLGGGHLWDAEELGLSKSLIEKLVSLREAQIASKKAVLDDLKARVEAVGLTLQGISEWISENNFRFNAIQNGRYRFGHAENGKIVIGAVETSEGWIDLEI
jgi:hypothetical protein